MMKVFPVEILSVMEVDSGTNKGMADQLSKKGVPNDSAFRYMLGFTAIEAI
ncbi:MAG: hypothetical protein IPG09_16830 [Ignavibacteria bacterium]|nr:hypothetical protein [Ignavibacteria bacterium]